MAWQLNISESFFKDLQSCPKKTQNQFRRKVIRDLRKDPVAPRGSTIKKLADWRNAWRYRIGDYRVIYLVTHDKKTATCLRIGHRKDIYEAVGLEDDGGPKPEVIVQISEEELERGPTEEEIRASVEVATQESIPDRAAPLPLDLDDGLLESMSIPEEFREILKKAETEGDLLECAPPVPDDVLLRVLNHMYPKNIEERLHEPRRKLDEDKLKQVIEGQKTLESLMLVLDEDQEAFLGRMNGVRPQGPWLVKGGPGSGKSLLALYAIQRLLEQQELEVRKPLRILLTTYTNALTGASRVLLRELGVDVLSYKGKGKGPEVHVSTCHRVVRSELPNSDKTLLFTSEERVVSLMEHLIVELGGKAPATFKLSAKAVLDEIDWVILGRNIQDLASYKEVPRIGRRRPLGARQRTHIWHLWKRLERELDKDNSGLEGQQTIEALERFWLRKKGSSRAIYDYVFIDEAQDLKLAELQYLFKICKKPSQIFITADANQSIYGGGMPWKEVAADLNFTGNTRIFKLNHRNTKEVWEAILPIATGSGDHDPETLGSEAYKPGPPPNLYPYSPSVPPDRPFTHFGDPLVDKIREALSDMTSDARMPYEYAAVLVPSSKMTEDIAAGLPPEMNAKAMVSRTFDVQHRGVKVATFHAAKGLQFPIVVVAGAEDGLIPKTDNFDDEDEMERHRRTLFVACSRAKGLLGLVYPKNNPSRFLCSLDLEQWDIHGERAWDHCPEDPPSSEQNKDGNLPF
jgi:addiction module RelE/StbE family toxin